MANVILLNNLFNGEYIEDKVGGEIINMYQSDNDKYYVYVNPYGNIDKKWDNKIKHVLFMRSIGNGLVKIIAKAEIEKQIACDAVFSKKEHESTPIKVSPEQEGYIKSKNITYGKVKLHNLGSWSKFFVTFQAKSIHKSKKDIYLTVEGNSAPQNVTVLKKIKKINNQSQKLYITDENENYHSLIKIIEHDDLWEGKPVGKIVIPEENKSHSKSFLSIIKKENDELVNSNLLAYFLEYDNQFWSDFATNVLKINKIKNCTRKITRETIGNIDLFIEAGDHVIVIENKIKSGINGIKTNGYSQLEKYVEKAEDYIGDSTEISFFILRPNYNNEEYKSYTCGTKYTEIKYSKIYEIIKNRNDVSLYFDEFIEVVKKHSSEYDNELFEIMNERFIEQIRNNI